jgi:hypothetical protein
MSHYFTAELGRLRTEEAIARADRYRLAQQAKSQRGRIRRERSRTFLYRRVLAAVGVSALMLVGVVAVAQARPIGPGPAGGGVPTDITVDRDHPQVKGKNPGQPVPSEADAYNFKNGSMSDAVALRLRAHYYRELLLADRAERSPVADAAEVRALNEPSRPAPVTGVEIADSSEDGFPVLGSLAVILGVVVLGAGGLAVFRRSQHSPKTT